MKVAFVFPPPWAPWAPSYAMALLSASAKQQGHSFVGFDMNIDMHNHVNKSDRQLWQDDHVTHWTTEESLNQLVNRYSSFISSYAQEIVETGTRLCAFSVTSASSSFSRIVAQKIKEYDDSIVCFFGGPHCFRSEGGLDHLEDPAVDVICTGEGDRVWPAFLEAFENNGYKIPAVKGICYRDGDAGIIDHGDPDLVRQLNEIPFADYDSTDFSKYTLTNRICLMMSRGCINNCSYCSEKRNFRVYRYRSPENLFEEVSRNVELVRARSTLQPHINFSDSLINGRPDVLEKFCDLVIENDLKFTWGGMAVLRKEMTHDLLAKMKKAGFVEVMWGLESGSKRVLELMNKTIFSIEMAEEIIKSASALEISQCANFIVGFPGETEEMFLETAQFVLRNREYFNNIGLPLLEIRQNSRVFDKYRDFGIQEPEPIRWKTVDNSNTYDLRIARRNLLAALLGEQLFDQGRYTDKDGPPPADMPASVGLSARSAGKHMVAKLGRKLQALVRRQGQ